MSGFWSKQTTPYKINKKIFSKNFAIMDERLEPIKYHFVCPKFQSHKIAFVSEIFKYFNAIFFLNLFS